jgi:hypothetical protein
MTDTVTMPAPPTSRRLPARAAALVGSLILLRFGLTSWASLQLRVEELPSDILTFVVLFLAPVVCGEALAWWAWKGWSIPVQPRWMTAIRWGVAGGFLWTVAGTLLFIAYMRSVQGRDAGNLAFLPASLTAFVGFLIGFVVGWRRPQHGRDTAVAARR